MSIAEIRRMADLGSGKVLTKPVERSDEKRIHGGFKAHLPRWLRDRSLNAREHGQRSAIHPNHLVAAMSISEIIRLKRTEALAKTAVSRLMRAAHDAYKYQ